MTEHVGSGPVVWTKPHRGVSIETTARHVATGNYTVHGAGYGPAGRGHGR